MSYNKIIQKIHPLLSYIVSVQSLTYFKLPDACFQDQNKVPVQKCSSLFFIHFPNETQRKWQCLFYTPAHSVFHTAQTLKCTNDYYSSFDTNCTKCRCHMAFSASLQVPVFPHSDRDWHLNLILRQALYINDPWVPPPTYIQPPGMLANTDQDLTVEHSMQHIATCNSLGQNIVSRNCRRGQKLSVD